MIRTYDELITLETFEDRYSYLRLEGQVGIETFGFDRYLNQRFYRSAEWRRLRQYIVARDLGLDLGIAGRDIHDRILIHHMNPITEKDLLQRTEPLLDPQNLICTSHNTHNAIHFGDDNLLIKDYVPRRPGDTILW